MNQGIVPGPHTVLNRLSEEILTHYSGLHSEHSNQATTMGQSYTLLYSITPHVNKPASVLVLKAIRTRSMARAVSP